MTIIQICDMLITKELILMADSIMLDKAKDFAVNIVNLFSYIRLRRAKFALQAKLAIAS